MEPSSDWIASLIEGCLSLYSRGRTEELDVEDDGSNLRFSIQSGYPTLINDWPRGDVPNCNVTDSKTQIDAFLSQESLRTYREAFPDKPMDRNVRGYIMEIKQFEVVFVYTTAEPSVHLYVEEFAIDWDRPKFKGPPRGRKLKRHKSTASVMKEVFKAINSQRTGVDKTPPPDHEGSHEQQLNGSSQVHATQNFLVSQVQAPPVPQTGAEYVTNDAHNSASATNQLLGHLGSRTKPTDKDPPPNNDDLNKHAGHVKDRTTPQRSSHNLINSVSNNKIGVEPEVHQSAVARASSSVDQTNQASEVPNPHHVNNEMGKRSEQKSSKEPSTNPEKAQHHERPDDSLFVKDNNEIPSDPWQGMRKIRKLDVVIPSNQLKLLEQHERHWVPPPKGQQMPRGCVPPELLSQWNSAVLRRKRESSRESKEPTSGLMQIQSQPGPVEPHKGASEVDAESEEDSESDEYFPWSESPTRETGRRELPEDSSPIKPNPMKQRVVSRKEKDPSIHADQTPKESHVDVKSNDQNENGTAQNSVPEESVVENHQNDINDAAKELEPAAQKDTTQDQPFDYDEDSDESMMDTSVPCPLVRSSQAYHASQSDQEVSSSGPPLPDVRERVQVMETPAANFKRMRSVVPSKVNDEPGHEQISPQGAKSSSQSRIVNTYASNNSEARGTQNTLDGTQSEHGAHSLDIMATQVSNGSWSMHDASSLPSSACFLYSSAPKPREPSPLPHSSNESVPSSKPFSSHNEMISSIEEDDKDQSFVDLQSSAHGLPSQSAHPSPLKRSASEIGNYGKSLAKRHQISRIQSEHTSRRESTLGIVSRRQSYISHKDDRAEAQRVFEKFQNDYPIYSGDFGHFSELCYKLRVLRTQDALKRSFLWDDFIIKNLTDFPSHLKDSSLRETKVLPYEEFFLSNYNRPSHKKRSLTADGIEKAASQHVSYPSESPVSDRSATRDEINTSFTGSLVARFSNFHAHSFGPIIRNPSEDNINVDQMSVVVPSPAKDTVREQPPAREDTPVSDLFVPMSPAGLPHADPDDHDPGCPPDGSVMTESQSQSQSQGKNQSQDQDQNQSQNESQTETSDDTDMMDATHETASVELGEDDSPRATSPVIGIQEEAEKSSIEDEPEDEDENWFVSLRHIRQPDPGWWDDPNTPIKKWAQADQDVLSERVQRPGWARMPVDEKGVIQPCRLQSK